MDDLFYLEAENDDVKAEYALRKLEGKSVSMSVLRKEMTRERKRFPVFSEDPELGQSVFAVPGIPNLEQTTQLVEWAAEQGPQAQELIREFFENPENNVVDVIRKLRKLGLIEKENTRLALGKGAKQSFPELLRRQFRKHKRFAYDQLWELAYREFPGSDRPEMNLQDALLTLASEGLITEVEEGVYECTETN